MSWSGVRDSKVSFQFFLEESSQWLTVHFQGGHHGQEAERDGEGHEQEADRAGEDLVIVLYLN